jgi:hypothetical protein
MLLCSSVSIRSDLSALIITSRESILRIHTNYQIYHLISKLLSSTLNDVVCIMSRSLILSFLFSSSS